MTLQNVEELTAMLLTVTLKHLISYKIRNSFHNATNIAERFNYMIINNSIIQCLLIIQTHYKSLF